MLNSGFFQEIDEKRVRQLRDTSEAIGNAYHKAMRQEDERESEQLAIIAATYLRRAAANSILLDDFDRCARLFRDAGRLYHHVGSPYGAFMDALGGQHASDFGIHRHKPSSQTVYALLSGVGREWRSQGDFLRMQRKELEEFRGSRIGVLSVPVEYYLELFDVAHEAIGSRDISQARLREAFLPFVHGYSAALQRARRDRYHWTRLAMVFHPVEPDVIGVFLVVGIALMEAGVDFHSLLEGFPVDREALAAVIYCFKRMNRGPNNGMERDKE
ncbi:MAG: hypothetical protein H7A43_03635 [Verrucomicrobia bacterium]|nr:hypothetical protein [Verrucomicrobiota bacterium]